MGFLALVSSLELLKSCLPVVYTKQTSSITQTNPRNISNVQMKYFFMAIKFHYCFSQLLVVGLDSWEWMYYIRTTNFDIWIYSDGARIGIWPTKVGWLPTHRGWSATKGQPFFKTGVVMAPLVSFSKSYQEFLARSWSKMVQQTI